MSKISLKYYGHSCFKVESKDGSVVFDPYENGSVPGLRVPSGLSADMVICSHEHHDHNAASLISLSGKKNGLKYHDIIVPHDDANGSKRGMTKVSFVEMDDLVIAHLGDIGRLPSEDEYKELKKADVVLIPCAGFYTIDSAQALEIIKHLKTPCLKVLMHFREGATGYDAQEDIQHVMSVIPGVHRIKASSLEIDSKNVPNEIITLIPDQD